MPANVQFHRICEAGKAGPVSLASQLPEEARLPRFFRSLSDEQHYSLAQLVKQSHRDAPASDSRLDAGLRAFMLAHLKYLSGVKAKAYSGSPYAEDVGALVQSIGDVYGLDVQRH